MNRCCRFRVSGRVQGVFYRATACDEARRLGLNGWVRNLPNGDVELLACGNEKALEQLEVWLWQGPPHARVAQVVREKTGDMLLEGFHVRYY